MLMLQLQAYAACDDEVIGARVGASYGQLKQSVMDISGATLDEIDEFFAFGMYLSVQAAVSPADLPDIVARRHEVLANGGPFNC